MPKSVTGHSFPEKPAVDLQQVVFNYGADRVLDDLSLQIASGQIFGILGPNGAGKTTIFRLLVGLLKPQSGSIQVLGEHPSSRLASRIGYMPQLNALYLELSIKQNVEFFARMYGLSEEKQRRTAVEAVIELVDLQKRMNDPILHLSGGMRQRVSLAIALVHTPTLLIMDEPTVGLDPEIRAGFWDHFRSLATSGTTLLVSSHTMDDATHCDRLGFIRHGRLVAEGTPTDLRGRTEIPNASLEDAFLHFVRKE